MTAMPRPIRITVLALAALLAVLVIAALAVQAIDANPYRAAIAARIERALGRPVSIEGPLTFQLLITPAVVVEDVVIANAPWGSRPEMLRLARLEVRPALLPLLRGQVTIDAIALSGLQVFAETDHDGRGNWQQAPAPSPGTEAPVQPPPTVGARASGRTSLPVIRRIDSEDVQLTYRNGRTGQVTTIILESIGAEMAGTGGPAEVRVKGAFETAPFAAELRLGPLRALVDNVGPYPVQLQAKAFGAALSAEGTLAEPRTARGIDVRVKAAAEETAAVVAALRSVDALVRQAPILAKIDLAPLGPLQFETTVGGSADLVGLIDVRLSLGRPGATLITAEGSLGDLNRIEDIDLQFSVDSAQPGQVLQNGPDVLARLGATLVTGRLTGGGRQAAISGLDARFGDNRIAGDVAFDGTRIRPMVTAALTSPMLDVTPWMELAGPDGGSGKAGDAPPHTGQGSRPAPEAAVASRRKRLFSSDPLPLAALSALDADIDVALAQLMVRHLSFRDVRIKARLADGHLTAAPLSAQVAGGTINATAQVVADRPKFALIAKARAIHYDSVLAQLGRPVVADGDADMDVDVAGVGQSLQEIMASLDGSVRAVTVGGTVRANLLDALLSALGIDSGLGIGDTTRTIRCGVVDFAFRGGRGSSRALVFETPELAMVGGGEINLASETINLRLLPRAKVLDLVRLSAVPVEITGPLADPTIVVTPVGAAEGIVVGALSSAGDLAKAGVDVLKGLAAGKGVDAFSVDVGDYCTPALAGRPVPSPADAAGKPAATGAVKETIEDAAKDVKKGLKRLFGN